MSSTSIRQRLGWALTGVHRDASSAAWPALTVLAGAAVAVGVLWQPLVTGAALALLLLAGVFGVGGESRLPRLFLGCFGVVLAGYAFLGRGFAYLGVWPVFVGELSARDGSARS